MSLRAAGSTTLSKCCLNPYSNGRYSISMDKINVLGHDFES